MGCPCHSRRHFLRGFVAVAASALAGPPAFAQAPLCVPAAPAVVVRSRSLQPSYDYSLAVADLAHLTVARNPAKGTRTQHGLKPAGLTLADFYVDWTITLQGKREGTRSCMQPARIEVDVRIDHHRVYVARDATNSATCQRDVVLEHEGRHVKINLDFVDDAKRRVEQALAAFAPSLPVMEGNNLAPAGIAERYKQLVRRPIETAFDGALATANSKHAAMDTNEAYARDWSRCRV
jgi:hypothetical protein